MFPPYSDRGVEATELALGVDASAFRLFSASIAAARARSDATREAASDAGSVEWSTAGDRDGAEVDADATGAGGSPFLRFGASSDVTTGERSPGAEARAFAGSRYLSRYRFDDCLGSSDSPLPCSTL